MKTVNASASKAFTSADRVARDLADLKHSVAHLKAQPRSGVASLYALQALFSEASIEIANLQLVIAAEIQSQYPDSMQGRQWAAQDRRDAMAEAV